MPSLKGGFTLIELLVVMAIIGVLAAIAIPRFTKTKDRAYIATMTSDLKNLATAQGSYFSDNQTYTTTLTSTQFRSSAGVTVSITGATTTSWSATAAHSASTRTCGISYGGTGSTDGQPQCN